jgi:NifU-like protein involved in Fe-S cluster formation
LPGDGPYIKLWLTLDSEGHRITAAAYQANGCPSSIACGSIVAQVLQGRTVEEALRLEPHDINLLLGGLPEGKEYCAEMAVKALRSARLGGESNAQ